MRSLARERIPGWRCPVRRAGEAAGPDEREELGPGLREAHIQLVMVHLEIQTVVVPLKEGPALEAERSVLARRPLVSPDKGRGCRLHHQRHFDGRCGERRV